MFLVDLFSLGVVAFHLFVAALPTIILLLTVILLVYQIYYYRSKIQATKNNCDDSGSIK